MESKHSSQLKFCERFVLGIGIGYEEPVMQVIQALRPGCPAGVIRIITEEGIETLPPTTQVTTLSRRELIEYEDMHLRLGFARKI